jgi:hypothetical protein
MPGFPSNLSIHKIHMLLYHLNSIFFYTTNRNWWMLLHITHNETQIKSTATPFCCSTFRLKVLTKKDSCYGLWLLSNAMVNTRKRKTLCVLPINFYTWLYQHWAFKDRTMQRKESMGMCKVSKLSYQGICYVVFCEPFILKRTIILSVQRGTRVLTTNAILIVTETDFSLDTDVGPWLMSEFLVQECSFVQ